MSEVWWGPEAGPNSQPNLASDGQPILLPSARSTVSAEVTSRIAAFTPAWTNRSSSDAGMALVRLFGEQMEPALQRLNQLPLKAMVEFFNAAGISPLPATPAEVMLEFQVSSAAPQSVLVPSGFQVGAPPADGTGDMVIFETTSDVHAAPATISAMFTQQGGEFVEIDMKGQQSDPPVPFRPFGTKPVKGRALLIGLDSVNAPTSRISLGIQLAALAGSPPPAMNGGLLALPVDPAPALVWEIFDGAAYQPAELLKDETGGFIHSGIVELGLPSQWGAGIPLGLDAKPVRWLRVRISYGQFTKPPSVAFLKINMARALAARTTRDEVPDPVAGSGGIQMKLSQTPVLAGTLVLRVDQGGFDPLTGAEISGDAGKVWSEVDSLINAGPDDLVYTLDVLTGIVTFGDGNHGALVPAGFRNVVAVSYQAGGGSAGAVAAKAASTLLDSVPFLSSASNPLKASGGTPRESQAAALVRAPQEIRARHRAVTVADYALLAARSPGASVARAQAIAGFHPSYPGAFLPGVVGVIVVPLSSDDGPPMPSEETLEAVSSSLSKSYAPAGVAVVAGAPLYHTLRAEIGVILDRGTDEAVAIQSLLTTLDGYIDPLNGGSDQSGWRFGGTLGYFALLRLLTSVKGVKSLPRLNLVIDGIRKKGCTDVSIEPNALFWPATHEVTVLSEDQA